MQLSARHGRASRPFAPNGGTSPAGFATPTAIDSASRSRSSAIARASRSRIRAHSRRVSCCLRTPRSPIRATAGSATISARRARASGSPARRRTRPHVWIDDWSLKLVGDVYVASDRGARFPIRPSASRRRRPSCSQGDARLFAQGSEHRASELLLQPAAARGLGQGRDRRQGRERHRHRLARSRMVERSDWRPRRAAGTGSASTSTTAAR